MEEIELFACWGSVPLDRDTMIGSVVNKLRGNSRGVGQKGCFYEQNLCAEMWIESTLVCVPY